jgi:tetratricopeptide (TPR) repeat protein
VNAPLNGVIRMAAVAMAVAAPLRAQPGAMESLRAAVISRWDFQQHYPAARKLFRNLADAGERRLLLEQLRPLAASAPGAEAAVNGFTFTAGSPSESALATVWADLALGVAEEKSKAGGGGENLASVSALAKGNLGLNYELARILVQAGMPKPALAFRKEVHRSMLEKGYLRVPDLAKLELWKARAAAGRGDFRAARQSLDFAKSLDPLSPWVPFQTLILHFREHSPLAWDLGYLWTALGETLRFLRWYDVQTFFLINLAFCLHIALGIFGAVGLLILFLRHFPRIAHPWAEKLPGAVELRVRYLAIALVPLSLVVGGAGYAVLGLLGAMLLWKHCASHEKSILKLVMFIIAMLPLLVMWEQSMQRHLDPRYGLNLYHQAWSRGYERALTDRAVAFPMQTHEDSLFRSLALSMQYKKQGNYLRAAEYGREAASIEPGNGFVLLNSGNLDMATFEYSKAVAVYGKARRVVPDLVETWFNSSQAELYNNNSHDHKKYLDAAAELDAQWVTQWLKDNDENFPVYPATRKAMDPILGTGLMWRAAWQSLLNLEFLRVPLHAGIMDVQGSWLLGAVLAAALALYFRFRHYSRNTHGWDLFECRICGRVMCRTCRKGVHCQNCFKTVAGIHENRIRFDLIARLRNRSAQMTLRTAFALNAVFPGSGDLYLGKSGGRFIWPLATSLCLGALWGLNHAVMEYPAFALGPLRWLPVLPLAAIWCLFNLKQLRRPVDPASVLPSATAAERMVSR